FEILLLRFDIDGDWNAAEAVIPIGKFRSVTKFRDRICLPLFDLLAFGLQYRGALSDATFHFAYCREQGSSCLLLTRFARLNVSYVAIPKGQRSRISNTGLLFLVRRFFLRIIRP